METTLRGTETTLMLVTETTLYFAETTLDSDLETSVPLISYRLIYHLSWRTFWNRKFTVVAMVTATSLRRTETTLKLVTVTTLYFTETTLDSDLESCVQLFSYRLIYHL